MFFKVRFLWDGVALVAGCASEGGFFGVVKLVGLGGGEAISAVVVGVFLFEAGAGVAHESGYCIYCS